MTSHLLAAIPSLHVMWQVGRHGTLLSFAQMCIQKLVVHLQMWFFGDIILYHEIIDTVGFCDHGK